MTNKENLMNILKYVFASSAMLTSMTLAIVAKAQEEPRCHVYLPSSGWTTNARAQVRTEYSAQNLCASQLNGYPCYRYFESREGCSTDDSSLIDLFLKDAEQDGVIIR